MTRYLVWVLIALALLASASLAHADEVRVGKHITSATTTTVLTGVASKTILIVGGHICIDGNGVATGITLQDSTPTNLVGTSVVYVLNPGQCLAFGRAGGGYYVPTGAAKDLQLVTGAAGPVELYLELIQQ